VIYIDLTADYNNETLRIFMIDGESQKYDYDLIKSKISELISQLNV